MTDSEKMKLIDRDWRSFEKYPKDRSNIMLHVMGHVVKGNTTLHDFFSIKFNTKKFSPRAYIKQIAGVTWSYSWLPLREALTGQKK